MQQTELISLRSQLLGCLDEDKFSVLANVSTFLSMLILEYADLITSLAFVDELSSFMKGHHGPQWTFHKMRSPASGGDHMNLGSYTCSPGAFAQGTFGQVTAGWTLDGAAVAIKRFIKPRQTDLNSHREMMAYIGEHVGPSISTKRSRGLTLRKDNILALLDCVSNFNISFPGTFCVYRPLAMGSLKEVINLCRSDVSAQITLLVDYLKGLTYPHEEKGVMHRDINPNNLGVVSFNPPKGIILDLDSATRSEVSEDHMQGTIPYLAPEIIDLKVWDTVVGSKPGPYGRSVDVWAVGLSVFTA